VEVLQPENYAAEDEPDGCLSELCELLFPEGAWLDEGVYVSPLRPFHRDIVVLVVPEGMVGPGYKRTLVVLEDSLLQQNVIDEALLVNLLLPHLLYGVHPLLALNVAQVYIAKTPHSQNEVYREGLESYPSPRLMSTRQSVLGLQV